MLDKFNKAARRVPTWVIYLLGLLPLGFIIFQTVTGTIGPDPVKAIEWSLGLWALRFLIATLCITPLRWVGVNLVKFRRQLGLVAFAYVVLHFTTWLTLDMGLRWDQILRDLYKRWYILIGMSALLMLIPLAITSNNTMVRRMGALNWNRLHKLAYLATGLGALHFLMSGKVYTGQMQLYAGAVLVLLALRVVKNGPRKLVWT